MKEESSQFDSSSYKAHQESPPETVDELSPELDAAEELPRRRGRIMLRGALGPSMHHRDLAPDTDQLIS